MQRFFPVVPVGYPDGLHWVVAEPAAYYSAVGSLPVDEPVCLHYYLPDLDSPVGVDPAYVRYLPEQVVVVRADG